MQKYFFKKTRRQQLQTLHIRSQLHTGVQIVNILDRVYQGSQLLEEGKICVQHSARVQNRCVQRNPAVKQFKVFFTQQGEHQNQTYKGSRCPSFGKNSQSYV
uniref:Uncharacterized protein n=1 Tax=Sphaerodactylus townsendi TaxID=933632 RepID=A0ACB8EZT1_9SAUR